MIFSIPGAPRQHWQATVHTLLALAPEHISTYSLTIEEGTRFARRHHQGRLAPVSEDDDAWAYAWVMETLAAAGYEHYEVSNFARPGCRCRHNETYWANEAYFGFGMGAARYVLGRRELNTRDLTAYIRHALSGEPATFQSEELEPVERARETMAVQLRRADGIDRTGFPQQTGFDLDTVAGAKLSLLMEQGLLQDDGKRVLLTREGKYVADAVIERLL